MSREEQLLASSGSQRWIQEGVNHPSLLNELILPKLVGVETICWRSPLASDQYAEYRDGEFLETIGVGQLGSALKEFWPSRGPRWDALAQCDDGSVLLVEAKAHIGELCTSPSKAGAVSLDKIKAALDETASYLGAERRAPWSSVFYQLANRIAHLHFLRNHAVKAWLVLINFTGDTEMNGPSSEAEWRAAYQVVWHVLGLPKHHKLSPYILDIFPEVSSLH
jgi:hypothetical protein